MAFTEVYLDRKLTDFSWNLVFIGIHSQGVKCGILLSFSVNVCDLFRIEMFTSCTIPNIVKTMIQPYYVTFVDTTNCLLSSRTQ